MADGRVVIDAIFNGQKAQQDFNSLNQSMQSAGQRMISVGQTMTAAVTVPIIGAGVAAIATGMKFDTSMSKVAAVTGATGDELAKMRDMAKEMGRTTQFSASEAAEAMGFLGMAGFDTTQIMASLPQVLDLATAGHIDLARAADISSNILTGFGLKAEDMGRVTDVMAKTASSANTNIEQLGYAMSYVAPVAEAAGWSIEETSAAIGIMSNAGIQGEKAGTALRGIISSLISPAGQTKDALEKLGLTAEDVNPQTKSLAEILKTLEGAGLDTATAMELVGVEAGPALLAMMKEGSAGLTEFTGELENADGSAKKMAQTMADNAGGDLKSLLSAVEAVALAFYEQWEPAIRQVVQWLRNLASSISEADPKTVQLVSAILAIAAAIGPVLLVIGHLVAAFGHIGTAVGFVVKAFNLLRLAFLTNPFGLIITAVIILAFLIYKYWDEIVAFLIAAWNVIKETAVAVWNAIKQFIVATWEGLKEAASAVWNAIVTGIMAILQPFIDAVTNIFNGMKDGVMMVFEGLKQYFTAVWGLIKNIFLGALLLLLNLFTGDFEAMRSNAKAIWDNIKGYLMAIWEAIKKIFSGALSAVKGAVSAAWENLKNIISRVSEAIKSTISRIWNSIKSFFTTTLTGIVSSVRTKMTEAYERIKSIWNRAKSFLQNIDLRKIGADIIRGLLNGISSMAKKVLDKAKEIADGVKSRIQKALGIASPSKVMIEFGKWTGEGLSIGLDRSMKKVADSAGKMVGDGVLGIASPLSNPSVVAPQMTPNRGVTIVQHNRINVEGNLDTELYDQIMRKQTTDTLNTFYVRGIRSG
jgi:TP901 family phage tail tape measure protein